MIFLKRAIIIILAALFIFTACSGNASQSSGSRTPDEIFSGASVPDDSKAPSSMMEISSQQLVNNIRIGWNLGNALDCCLTAEDDTDTEVTETLWGNTPASQRLFEALVDNGINAVRLPVTWRDHMDEAGTIDEVWFNRVQQVAEYAYNCGMYVIITMYHDGAEDVENGAWLRLATEDYDAAIARYQYLWKQISEKFSGYNERVLFESMNEVDFAGISSDESFTLLNKINQVFVNTVRSTGGNNPWRHLLIAGYNADIAPTCDSRFVMPTDPSERCILSVHYYIPEIYCREAIQDKWGSTSDQIWMESMITMLKTNFTDKGIPVIITEYDAKGEDIPSRVFFCEKLTKLCKDAGIASFLWDGGSEFSRTDFTWNTPGLIEALKRASGGEAYTPQKSE